MKLYTEEALLKFIDKNFNINEWDLENGKIPHIELPSDEEIESKLQLPLVYEFEKGSIYSRVSSRKIFIIGAKWMRDTIKAGNK